MQLSMACEIKIIWSTPLLIESYVSQCFSVTEFKMFSINLSKVGSKVILLRGSSKLKHMLTLAFGFVFQRLDLQLNLFQCFSTLISLDKSVHLCKYSQSLIEDQSV